MDFLSFQSILGVKMDWKSFQIHFLTCKNGIITNNFEDKDNSAFRIIIKMLGF